MSPTINDITLRMKDSSSTSLLLTRRYIVHPFLVSLAASLMVRATRWRGEHQMQLMVHPDARGPLEEPLVRHALALLASYPSRPTVIRHPAEHRAAMNVFLAHGFGLRRTLMAMRKKIRG